MTTEKQHITIKGVKEGLVFLLDDQCSLDELLKELKFKLENSHQQLLTGPIVHVHVKLGARRVTEEQKEQIVAAIKQRGNLLVQSVDSEAEAAAADDGTKLLQMYGVVRSGQTVTHDGILLLMGDVNPGGTLLCTGDIYVLGSLRGMAHAGTDGRTESIIAASLMKPTQLRIGDVISRPPDEWVSEGAAMEFAYLEDSQMKIDKLSQLGRIRKDSTVFKGV